MKKFKLSEQPVLIVNPYFFFSCTIVSQKGAVPLGKVPYVLTKHGGVGAFLKFLHIHS